MLRQLTVRDYALVESVDVDFAAGLTVMTGESGAGKSILLGALGLVLGDRATADSVRPGTRRADICAEFDIGERHAALQLLADNDLEDPDHPGRCLVRRTVTAEGRSRAFVNGAAVTLQALRALTSELVDVYGQHEHQRLAQRQVQLSLLDDFGDCAALAQQVQQAHSCWQNAAHEAADLEADLAARSDRAELLAYQVAELDDVAVEAGEVAELETLCKRLGQAQDIQAHLGEALDTLADANTVRRVAAILSEINDDHASLTNARELIDTALTYVDETTTELRGYAEALQVDPHTLAEAEARLNTIHDLARKHRVRSENLNTHHDELREELIRISTDRSEAERLQALCAEEYSRFRTTAEQLSSARRAASDPFGSEISACMQSLGMAGGALQLEFSAAEGDRGLEAVEYQLITNPKYPAAPLTQVASGGERTRISLAIAVVAASRSRLPCLVLDEADVGVGGTTADVVGRLLRDLAAHTQVICVTHAPQVAALGDHHLRVLKTSEYETQIENLSAGDRVDELARMLAGADVTDKARDYARTLIAEAAQP